MRRVRTLLVALVALLLAVPVAAAKDDAARAEPARAVGVTTAKATLQAQVVPGVLNAVAVFQYGTTTDYGETAAAAPRILPRDGANASAVVDDLQPGTTYHFRVVVSLLRIRLLAGADATFTTPVAAGTPTPPAKTTPPGKSHEDNGKSGTHPSDDQPDDDSAPAPVDAPAPPVLAKSVAVGPVAGTVRVRKPHGHGFLTLAAGANVPSGSVVDARKGTVALTSALDASGRTQTGQFHGGTFKLLQRRGGHGMVDIYLRGSLGTCRAHGARVASIARKKRRKKGRSLWGRDHGGRFRTHGASSVATVRGTRWLTKDTCAGTLTKVTHGAVSVRDLHRHKTVTVHAGHSYLAHRR